MKLFNQAVWFGVLAAMAGAAQAQQGQTVKIAYIDPLTGHMAALGSNELRTTQFFAQEFNKHNDAGVKFEVIGLDNKVSPQETVVALRHAQDQGVRYVLQGAGSGPALAIIEALEKNNARFPDKAVLYLNYAAIDPDLTGKNCSYWEFAFDTNSNMKLKALTDYIAEQQDIKKVYVVAQDYSIGQSFAKDAPALVQKKRPDIQIVGVELHPLAKVRDFAPYIAKIKASGADTVLTMDWGSDLQLLVKAAVEAGLNVKFYTYYASVVGTPTALGQGSTGKVYQVGTGYTNMGGQLQNYMVAYKKQFKEDLFPYGMYTVFQALTTAFVNAKSTDPVKVAAELEGLSLTTWNGPVQMRKQDHQLQQGLYVMRWEKTDAQNPYSLEDTGNTFVPVKHYSAEQVSTSSVCQMKRPAP